MAFEYHKPGLDIRDKELALNFACSLLRPIDDTLREVIVSLMTSDKIQLNMKLVSITTFFKLLIYFI